MRKLTLKNNWENRIWLLNGVEVFKPKKDIKKVTIDGNVFSVIWKEITVPYDDHGHNYYSTSFHGFIKDTGIFGAEISLEQLLEQKYNIMVV